MRLRPETSTTRAVAVTVRLIGVGARWRILTSLPTVAHPGDRCADGLAGGDLHRQNHHRCPKDEWHAFDMGADRQFPRDDAK
jgi:hypothetical protein